MKQLKLFFSHYPVELILILFSVLIYSKSAIFFVVVAMVLNEIFAKPPKRVIYLASVLALGALIFVVAGHISYPVSAVASIILMALICKFTEKELSRPMYEYLLEIVVPILLTVVIAAIFSVVYGLCTNQNGLTNLLHATNQSAAATLTHYTIQYPTTIVLILLFNHNRHFKNIKDLQY